MDDKKQPAMDKEDFAECFDDLPDGAFFALAKEMEVEFY